MRIAKSDRTHIDNKSAHNISEYLSSSQSDLTQSVDSHLSAFAFANVTLSTYHSNWSLATPDQIRHTSRHRRILRPFCIVNADIYPWTSASDESANWSDAIAMAHSELDRSSDNSPANWEDCVVIFPNDRCLSPFFSYLLPLGQPVLVVPFREIDYIMLSIISLWYCYRGRGVTYSTRTAATSQRFTDDSYTLKVRRAWTMIDTILWIPIDEDNIAQTSKTAAALS
jgi:hypothetical protein